MQIDLSEIKVFTYWNDWNPTECVQQHDIRERSEHSNLSLRSIILYRASNAFHLSINKYLSQNNSDENDEIEQNKNRGGVFPAWGSLCR